MVCLKTGMSLMPLFQSLVQKTGMTTWDRKTSIPVFLRLDTVAAQVFANGIRAKTGITTNSGRKEYTRDRSPVVYSDGDPDLQLPQWKLPDFYQLPNSDRVVVSATSYQRL